jgi:hypothetical protein
VAPKLPDEFVKRIEAVRNKRARLVLDRMAETGRVTTEELKDIGYDHPPRARMDALDLGFPIITTRVKSRTGRSIAAYSFDLTATLCDARSGRAAIPKKQRQGIIAASGGKCQLCGATHDLQVDHRVPYQIAGEPLKNDSNAFMVLDGSCNRRKSWTCEHCENFLRLKRVDLCQTCYWANPQEHSHVALEPLRRIDLVWQKNEVKTFDRFRKRCKREGKLPAVAIKEFVKSGK